MDLEPPMLVWVRIIDYESHWHRSGSIEKASRESGKYWIAKKLEKS